MKKILVLVSLVVMAALPSLAQGPVTGPYLVDYFSNTNAINQSLRLVNFGAAGTPLTSPVGDVCANIYVFDANQEMIACCSCRITPNGELTLSVNNDLISNPVTSVVPINGDIKLVSTAAAGSATCTPLTFNGGLLDSTVAFGTHGQTIQVNTGGGIGLALFVSETNVPPAALSSVEQSFLTQGCQFAAYLGSGKGICSCGNRLQD